MRHRHADPAEELNTLRDGIDELILLLRVLIEQKMELIKRRSGDLPMMFLVQIAERHRVGQKLIQVLDALLTRVFRQRDGHSNEMAEWLDFMRVLPGHGSRALQKRVDIEDGLAIGRPHFFATAVRLRVAAVARRRTS
jgi:hypothetical protein